MTPSLTDPFAFMADDIRTNKRVLEPHERISEVLFGLIMVLTFTGSLSIAESTRNDVRTMLIGALGCNIAWGIIDGVLYLMGCLAEKGRSLTTLLAVRKASKPEHAHREIADFFPAPLAAVLQTEELELMRQRLLQLPKPPANARLGKSDWVGAIAVFLLVFLTTFPVAIPFMFMQNVSQAMRFSNTIAIVMLFIAGIAYGRCVGRSALKFGIAMVVLGAVLVALTMALGG